MALDENLSNIISQILAPHINEMHKSNMTFRQTASENNDNLKQIVSQIYNAINYNNNNINSMLSSVESVNQQNQQMAMEIRSLASAINQNNMSLNNLLNHFNSFSNVTRRSMNRQTSIFSNFSESFGLFSKRFQVNMGMLGKRATGGAVIGTGAIQTGAAIAGVGAVTAASLGAYQYQSVQQARASQAEAAEDLPRTGPSRRERETAESEGAKREGAPASDDRTKYGNKDPSKPSGTDVGPSSHPYNVQARAKLYDELKNTPGLKEWVAGVIKKEGDPTAVLESIVNRALMSGKSLADSTNFKYSGNWRKSFFGPIRRQEVNPIKINPHMDRAFREVFEQGSNIIGYRTDQGLRGEHKPAEQAGLGHTVKGIRGEYYSEMGKQGANFRKEQERKRKEWEEKNPNWRQQQGKPDATPAPGTSTGPQPSGQPSSGQPSDATRTEFDPNKGKYTSESVRESTRKMSPAAQDALGKLQKYIPDIVISSGHRSRTSKYERDKAVPGAHTRGNAIDVSTRGKSKQELENIIQGLKKSGFNHILLEGDPPHIHAEIRPGRGFNIQNYKGGHPGISLEEARRAAEQVQRQEPPKPEQQAPQSKPQQQPSPVPSEQPKPKPEPGKMLPSGLLERDTEQRLRGQEPTPAPTPPPKTGAELNMRGTQEEAQRGQPQPQQPPTQTQQPQGEQAPQAPQTPAPQNVQPTTATASWVPKTGSQDYSNLAAYYGQKNIHDSYIQRGSQIV